MKNLIKTLTKAGANVEELYNLSGPAIRIKTATKNVLVRHVCGCYDIIWSGATTKGIIVEKQKEAAAAVIEYLNN